MIIFLRNNCFSFFVSLACVFLITDDCRAQDTLKTIPSNRLEKADVQWLCQWPSNEIKHKKKEIKQVVNDIFFGKKTIELVRPVDLFVSDQNIFWILDQQNNAIFNTDGNQIKIPYFIKKKNIPFSSLVSICKFRTDEMLCTDSYLNKIYVINSVKKEFKVLNDSLKINKVTGIAYSELTKEIWVLETGEHRIVVLNEKGEVVKKIGKRGNAKGEFNFPTHICIDKKGNVYVVDAMNFRVQVFDKNGSLISVFGKNGDATGYFACPKGIATDSYGHIYVVDALFHAVQIFDINGTFLYSFGTQGHGDGEFWMPTGIFIDENDKIFIADSYNSRIQIFQLFTRK